MAELMTEQAIAIRGEHAKNYQRIEEFVEKWEDKEAPVGWVIAVINEEDIDGKRMFIKKAGETRSIAELYVGEQFRMDRDSQVGGIVHMARNGKADQDEMLFAKKLEDLDKKLGEELSRS